MQQADQRGGPVKLLMAHDAQIIGVAGYLTQLATERIDIVFIAKTEYPAAGNPGLDFNGDPVDDGFPLIQDGDVIVMAAIISGITWCKNDGGS